MKVLIVNTVEFGINGISNVIMNYYKYSNKENVIFDFVVNWSINSEYREQIEQMSGSRDNIFILTKRNTIPFVYIKNLKRIIKRGNYDIIHIHGNSALMTIELLAAQSDKNLIKVVHAHNTDCSHKILHKILYSKFIKTYDYALACSEAAGKWLYKDNKYLVMNNAIEADRFDFDVKVRSQIRKKNDNDDKFVILHIGLFNEQKNHLFLIDIFKELLKREPCAELRLIGQGSKVDEIKEKVKFYGIEKSVVFVGTTHKPENEYMGADVFVFPSIFESFGLVTVEAQCSGLPCVVSTEVPNSVAITENIDFVSLDCSPEMWADIILKYRNFSDRRMSHIREVEENHYSIKKEAYKLLDFYKDILSETDEC